MSDMLFGTIIIIGGAYTLYHDGHVNMDVIYGRLSIRKKAFLDLVTSFFTFSFLIILIWEGGETAWRSLINLERDSTQWAPPIYPIKLMLPLGAFLLFLQVLAKFIRDFLKVTKRSE
jgi:TRAP-type mannitol/chloroaromatic compound transport system permease small subunit